jgi:hypothetical protein
VRGTSAGAAAAPAWPARPAPPARLTCCPPPLLLPLADTPSPSALRSASSSTSTPGE